MHTERSTRSPSSQTSTAGGLSFLSIRPPVHTEPSRYSTQGRPHRTSINGRTYRTGRSSAFRIFYFPFRPRPFSASFPQIISRHFCAARPPCRRHNPCILEIRSRTARDLRSSVSAVPLSRCTHLLPLSTIHPDVGCQVGRTALRESTPRSSVTECAVSSPASYASLVDSSASGTY
ncbi:hypothetical protein K466DRAFT_161085 [Polyporus arcularius HHB13444]|uniref:Uncharacterized protein n=1 Tax=Polyporus arcularius HHB13444 TaxID=1314778 RepID=A0A5C3PTI0_9APHY|nr:hypothetical protein K466DRAFT_161085 [Polyporus arcularius HHB13444]